MIDRSKGRFPFLQLGGLTAAALAIHGYHLGVEDGEIYVPAAKKLLDPSLYPFASEFFLSHGRMSLFSSILAWSARLTHLSMDWTLIVWYVLSVFALLASCWLLVTVCFSSRHARWGAMLVLTAVLAMPATNTGLLLIDPYLTARSFSTPLTIFALATFLRHRYALSGATMVLTALIHPQMVVYVLFLCGVIWLVERRQITVRGKGAPVMAAFVGVLPTGFRFVRATGAYREALYSRDYFFLYNWEWYHWLGLLAPLAILAWFWKGNFRGTLPGFKLLSFALIPCGLLSIAAGALLCLPNFDMFARLQPLRTFHLITLIFVVFFAGIVCEYAAKKRPWVIAAISIPLAVGMYFVGQQTYPNSAHIELPSTTSSNPWVNALLWIRNNTPKDAVFAVDSRYFKDEIGDVHGFRAVSERSALADYIKDGGVVSLFPNLADEWKQMTNATYGLNSFTVANFRYLKSEYPEITWTVIHGAAPMGMDCPYQQSGYSVCRLPSK